MIPPLLCNLGVGEPLAEGYEYLARSSRQLGGVSCVPRLRSAALASADTVLNSGGHPNLPPEHDSHGRIRPPCPSPPADTRSRRQPASTTAVSAVTSVSMSRRVSGAAPGNSWQASTHTSSALQGPSPPRPATPRRLLGPPTRRARPLPTTSGDCSKTPRQTDSCDRMVANDHHLHAFVR